MRRILMLGVAASAMIGLASADNHLKFKPGEDSRFNWASYDAFAGQYDLSGQTMTLFGPWTGADTELVENMVAYFEAATGADVQFTGSDSFEQQIVIDTQAGSPANIAIFPQPGLAADLASKGFLSPLPAETKDWVIDNYAAGQSWVDLGTFKSM